MSSINNNDTSGVNRGVELILKKEEGIQTQGNKETIL